MKPEWVIALAIVGAGMAVICALFGAINELGRNMRHIANALNAIKDELRK